MPVPCFPPRGYWYLKEPYLPVLTDRAFDWLKPSDDPTENPDRNDGPDGDDESELQEIESFAGGSILLRHRRVPPRHRHRLVGGRPIHGYLDRLNRVVA